MSVSQGVGFGSMTCALSAVDVKDFASHEGGRLEVEDRANDVGDLAHVADGVQGIELRMRFDGVHRRFDDPRRDRVHPNTALRIFDRERSGRGGQSAFRKRREHRGHTGNRVIDQARRELHDMAAALLPISATANCVM